MGAALLVDANSEKTEFLDFSDSAPRRRSSNGHAARPSRHADVSANLVAGSCRVLYHSGTQLGWRRKGEAAQNCWQDRRLGTFVLVDFSVDRDWPCRKCLLGV